MIGESPLIRAYPYWGSLLSRLERIDEARLNPSVVLAGPAEMCTQVLHLDQPNVEAVVILVIHAASQGECEAIEGWTVGSEVLSPKEHLTEGVQLSVVPVSHPGPEHVVKIMSGHARGQAGVFAIAKVAHSAQPVVEVVSQVDAQAVTADSPGIQVLVLVPHKELSLGCCLGANRPRPKEYKHS